MDLEQALRAAGVRELRAFTDAWNVDVVRRDDPEQYIDQALAHRQSIGTNGAVEAKLEFKWASKPSALKHLDAKVVDIYRSVLEAAWEGDISQEFRLLERLRTKLGITRRDHRVIELQLGRFPSANGELHTATEVAEAMHALGSLGLVLRVIVDRARLYCIPTEIAVALRGVLGIELVGPAYAALLAHLPVSTLRKALEQADQPFTGARDFLAARLIDGYVSPRAVLRTLSDDELTTLLHRFPTVRQDGSHEIRVRNIVKHFDQVVGGGEGEPSANGALLTGYFLELARRDYAKLRAAAVISKDREVDRLFEKATIELFREYFGYEAVPMDGSNHADGRVELGGQRVLLWDCKSCEGAYNLTDRLARQFLAYAHAAAPTVVSPLLVIGPGFSPESLPALLRLKTQCPPGTEIALITAEDLLWLARRWHQRRGKGDASPLPWELFATSGQLTQDVLSQRWKTFLGK
jgi:hypothetical protein